MKANVEIRNRFPERNPFSTRAVRPGALTYHLPNSLSPEDLVSQLRSNHWWGEILGPHGSGKSTLAHTLLPLLRAAGRNIRQFTLHQDEKRVPVSGADLKSWDAETQVIVDGYEQLGGWSRTILKRVCRRQRAGLLVTVHESVGLPLLFCTSVSLELAQQLVKELSASCPPLITADDVVESYRRHQGNLREVFFELYDLYESRRPR